MRSGGDEEAISFLGALSIPGVVEFSLRWSEKLSDHFWSIHSFSLFFAKLVSYTFLYWLPNYIHIMDKVLWQTLCWKVEWNFRWTLKRRRYCRPSSTWEASSVASLLAPSLTRLASLPPLVPSCWSVIIVIVINIISSIVTYITMDNSLPDFFLGGGDTNYADLWACSGQLVCSQTVFLAIFSNVAFSSQSPRCKITSSHGEPVHNACFNWNIALTLITGILVNGVISILCAHGLFTPLFQDHTPW